MNRKKREIDPHIISEIARCLGEINYGELVVTMHDARIVQVEKREKMRFDVFGNNAGGMQEKPDMIRASAL